MYEVAKDFVVSGVNIMRRKKAPLIHLVDSNGGDEAAEEVEEERWGGGKGGDGRGVNTNPPHSSPYGPLERVLSTEVVLDVSRDARPAVELGRAESFVKGGAVKSNQDLELDATTLDASAGVVAALRAEVAELKSSQARMEGSQARTEKMVLSLLEIMNHPKPHRPRLLLDSDGKLKQLSI